MKQHFTHFLIILKRELMSYFSTPVAYVFLIIFLVLMGIFTFYIGGFYERGQSDLTPFFNFHPWLYLVLVPALAMRMWAEERKSGTIELIMTLPVNHLTWVLGKFCATWVFIAIALMMTFPLWITVNYLGNPDNGVIIASYIGSWLIAGGYLAIGSFMSACTKNQVIAFVLTALIGFIFTLSGASFVIEFFSAWLPDLIVSTVGSLSFLAHFNTIIKGLISLEDIVFIFSIILVWLYATAIVIDMKKAH